VNIRVAKAERSRTNRMTDRQTRKVKIRVAKAERSRTNMTTNQQMAIHKAMSGPIQGGPIKADMLR